MLEFFSRLCYNISMQLDLSAVKKGSTVAAALSGGCDSMALLHRLCAVAKDYSIKIVAINVEHGIRGDESLRDTEFVKDYCQKTGVPLFLYGADCLKKSREEKTSIEEAARAARYECFERALNEGKCDYVATAHHLADNAETVLLNIFRGTGLKGLSGIKNRGKIIRPLIKTEKSEIEKYVKANGIPFVTDSSNLSSEYSRNFIRLNVLPKIREIFPEAEKSVSRLSDVAAEITEYLSLQAEALISTTKDGVKIKLPAHDVILKTALMSAFKKCGLNKDWQKVHVDDAVALADKPTGKSINLPYGFTAVREYDGISIKSPREKNETRADEVIKFGEGIFSFCGQTLKIERANDAPDLKSGLFIDLDKLPPDAVIRTRKNGDVFNKFGGGTKKLGDFFTDVKIPKDERDSIPVVASENEIYAIFGVAVSQKVKADETTVRLIKITKK